MLSSTSKSSFKIYGGKSFSPSKYALQYIAFLIFKLYLTLPLVVELYE